VEGMVGCLLLVIAIAVFLFAAAYLDVGGDD
jgi:hypothetical protein